MMYRSGWAEKPGQERILGIWIKKTDFEKILLNSTFTSYAQTKGITESEWKNTLTTQPVRLQWDPDHLPNGEKHTRKAIQLGIKGELLDEFGKQMIEEIVDFTSFVQNQRKSLYTSSYDELKVAHETVYIPSMKGLSEKIGIDIYENTF